MEVPSGLNKAERESIVNWNEQDAAVSVWTASPVVARRLYRLGLKPVHESRGPNGRLTGLEFEIPAADFRWGLKRRARRLTAQERAARTARLRTANARTTGIRSTEQPQADPRAAARQQG